MLTAIRKVARGWVAGILVGLLAAAFAIWGVNDVFRPAPTDTLVQAKGWEVTGAEFERELERRLSAARAETGSAPTRQEAYQQGLHTELLQGLSARKALDALAAKLNVRPSDALVAEEIRRTTAFQSQVTQAFDQDTYRELLARANYSEQEYEEGLRDELSRRVVLSAAVAGVRAPRSLARFIVEWESERRTVSVAQAPPTRAGAIPEPTDAAIEAFYKENQAALEAPERRELTIVRAEPAAFLAKVDAPEEKLRELYDFRVAQLQKTAEAAAEPPPSFEALREELRAEYGREEADILANQAVEDYEDALAAGESLEAAAAGAGLIVEKIPAVDARGAGPDGAPVPAAAALGEALAEAFTLEPSETTDFIAVEGGYAQVRVDDITPPAAPPLAEVRDQLAANLKARARAEALQAIAETVKAGVDGGKAFVAEARDQRLVLVGQSQEIDRSAAFRGPMVQLGQALFSAQPGEVVWAFAPDGSLLVAHVEKITRADPEANPDRLEGARAEAGELLTNDLLATLQQGVVTAAAPRTFTTRLDQLFGVGVDPTEAGGEPAS